MLNINKHSLMNEVEKNDHNFCPVEWNVEDTSLGGINLPTDEVPILQLDNNWQRVEDDTKLIADNVNREMYQVLVEDMCCVMQNTLELSRSNVNEMNILNIEHVMNIWFDDQLINDIAECMKQNIIKCNDGVNILYVKYKNNVQNSISELDYMKAVLCEWIHIYLFLCITNSTINEFFTFVMFATIRDSMELKLIKNITDFNFFTNSMEFIQPIQQDNCNWIANDWSVWNTLIRNHFINKCRKLGFVREGTIITCDKHAQCIHRSTDTHLSHDIPYNNNNSKVKQAIGADVLCMMNASLGVVINVGMHQSSVKKNDIDLLTQLIIQLYSNNMNTIDLKETTFVGNEVLWNEAICKFIAHNNGYYVAKYKTYENLSIITQNKDSNTYITNDDGNGCTYVWENVDRKENKLMNHYTLAIRGTNHEPTILMKTNNEDLIFKYDCITKSPSFDNYFLRILASNQIDFNITPSHSCINCQNCPNIDERQLFHLRKEMLLTYEQNTQDYLILKKFLITHSCAKYFYSVFVKIQQHEQNVYGLTSNIKNMIGHDNNTFEEDILQVSDSEIFSALNSNDINDFKKIFKYMSTDQIAHIAYENKVLQHLDKTQLQMILLARKIKGRRKLINNLEATKLKILSTNGQQYKEENEEAFTLSQQLQRAYLKDAFMHNLISHDYKADDIRKELIKHDLPLFLGDAISDMIISNGGLIQAYDQNKYWMLATCVDGLIKLSLQQQNKEEHIMKHINTTHVETLSVCLQVEGATKSSTVFSVDDQLNKAKDIYFNKIQFRRENVEKISSYFDNNFNSKKPIFYIDLSRSNEVENNLFHLLVYNRDHRIQGIHHCAVSNVPYLMFVRTKASQLNSEMKKGILYVCIIKFNGLILDEYKEYLKNCYYLLAPFRQQQKYSRSINNVKVTFQIPDLRNIDSDIADNSTINHYASMFEILFKNRNIINIKELINALASKYSIKDHTIDNTMALLIQNNKARLGQLSAGGAISIQLIMFWLVNALKQYQITQYYKNFLGGRVPSSIAALKDLMKIHKITHQEIRTKMNDITLASFMDQLLSKKYFLIKVDYYLKNVNVAQLIDEVEGNFAMEPTDHEKRLFEKVKVNALSAARRTPKFMIDLFNTGDGYRLRKSIDHYLKFRHESSTIEIEMKKLNIQKPRNSNNLAEKRRRIRSKCTVCKQKTLYCCSRCGIPMCASHNKDCFQKWHEEEDIGICYPSRKRKRE